MTELTALAVCCVILSNIHWFHACHFFFLYTTRSLSFLSAETELCDSS